jgi:amidase
MNDLTQQSALEMASLVRRREVSSRELVAAHLALIERHNPVLGAVTVVLADEALRRADEADRTEPSGPLHGVPITIKENIDLVGSATTGGLVAHVNALPAENAPIVERMLAAGAIPIARTNLPELGLRADTENPLRGRTKNPWDPSRSPGGSSGGEAAAIASRMSPLGLGNDVGGSLRNPAFCCGIVGFRPTMGRVPSASVINPPDPLSIELMATDGALGRTVADVEFATRLLNGAHRRDPVSVDVDFDRPPLPRRVAGVVTESIFGSVDAAVLDGVRLAADALATNGWAIEEVTVPEFERVHEIWTRIMAADIPDLLEVVGPLITPRLAEVLMEHTTFYGPDSIHPMAIFPERLRLMARWTEMFERTPVIVGPVLPEQAFPGGDDMRRGIDYVMRLLQYLTPAPLLGLPALAVPSGVIDGLPVGVQIHADRWNDAYCFEAGAAIESHLGSFDPYLPS